jgi:hypothetical protein
VCVCARVCVCVFHTNPKFQILKLLV